MIFQLEIEIKPGDIVNNCGRIYEVIEVTQEGSVLLRSYLTKKENEWPLDQFINEFTFSHKLTYKVKL